jgi:hypothetical protein
MMDIEPFVDVDRAAEFLCVARRRVLEMARAGEVPAHPIGCGKRKIWRFRLSELAQAIVTKERETSTRKRGIIDAGGSLAVPNGKGR